MESYTNRDEFSSLDNNDTTDEARQAAAAPPTAQQAGDALDFISSTLIRRNSLSIQEIENRSRHTGIPIAAFLQAIELLNLTKIIDAETGEESWEKPRAEPAPLAATDARQVVARAHVSSADDPELAELLTAVVPATRQQVAEALDFVTLTMLRSDSISMSQVEHGSVEFDIPFDALIQAIELLNLTKIIDAETGEESWDKTAPDAPDPDAPPLAPLDARLVVAGAAQAVDQDEAAGAAGEAAGAAAGAATADQAEPDTDDARQAANGSPLRPILDAKTNVETFIALHACGFWPLTIYPAGAVIETEDGPVTKTGKEPTGGKGWGLKRWNVARGKKEFKHYPTAGVGVGLGPGRGPDERWISDIEGDGTEAEDSRAKLMGGWIAETFGWASVKGNHELLSLNPERIKSLLPRLKPYQGKGATGAGVYSDLPGLPGLELRIGGYHEDGTVKQIQSVAPPTPGTDGTPRRWNGFETVADAPDAFYEFLERLAEQAEAATRTPPAGSAQDNGVARTVDTGTDTLEHWIRSQAMAAFGWTMSAEKNTRHETLLHKARWIAGYLHFWPEFEPEFEAMMISAANLATDGEPARIQDNPRNVRSAIANGKAKPFHWTELAPRLQEEGSRRSQAGKQSHFAGGGSRDEKSRNSEIDYRAMSEVDLGMVRFSDIVSRPVAWLWQYRLKGGAMALMAGMASEGKSTILLNLASLITTGGPWPDGSGNAPLGDVIILSAEDNPEDTLKPRFVAMGGDVNRITLLRAKYVIRKPGKQPEVHPTSLQDLAWWDGVFFQRPECKLLIVDPLPSYLGRGVNDSKNAEIRSVIEPFLHNIVEPSGICMLCNTHLNKSVDIKTPIHRISGSHAYGDLPRNVHIVARDPDELTKQYLKQVKCNNAPWDLPALAYKLEQVTVVADTGEIMETSKVTFDATPVQIDLEDIMTRQKERKKPGRKPDNTFVEWMFDWLHEHSGPQLWVKIFQAAGEAGFDCYVEDGKWIGGKMLTTARHRIPSLTGDRAGYKIRTTEQHRLKDKPLKLWELVPHDAPDSVPAAEHREPGEDDDDDDDDDDRVPF